MIYHPKVWTHLCIQDNANYCCTLDNFTFNKFHKISITSWHTFNLDRFERKVHCNKIQRHIYKDCFKLAYLWDKMLCIDTTFELRKNQSYKISICLCLCRFRRDISISLRIFRFLRYNFIGMISKESHSNISYII